VWGIVLPILLGTLIYLVFSPDAYVTRAFWYVLHVGNPFAQVKLSEMPWGIRLLRYYLSDFLWAVALMQSVILILGKENRLLAGAIGTVFCFICELTQLINTIPGTFDVRDLAMEGIAGFLVILS